MSIDMYLSSSDQQAESVSRVLSNRIAGYESIQAALNGFVLASPRLSGVTYDSAKKYSSQLLIPLVKGCILLDEAIKTSCHRLPSEYRSGVDSVDLKESDLVDKINRAARSIGRYMDLILIEQQKEKPNSQQINRLIDLESQCRDLKVKLEEKLQKLREFNSYSPEIFEEIRDLYQSICEGMRQAKTSWQAGEQSFKLPNRQNLAWIKSVENKWESRENNQLEIILAKFNRGYELSESEITFIELYSKNHPSTVLPNSIMKKIVLKNFQYSYGTHFSKAIEITDFNEDIMLEIWEEFTRRHSNQISLDMVQAFFEEFDGAIATYSLSDSTKLSKNVISLIYKLSDKIDDFTSISNGVFGKTSVFGTHLSSLSSNIIIGLDKIGYFSAKYAPVMDFGIQIYEGEEYIDSALKTAGHIGVSSVVMSASIATGADIGAKVGFLIGSAVPGLGNVAGLAIGTGVGATIGFVSGVAISYFANDTFDEIYDETIGEVIDWAEDGLRDLFEDILE